jgi:hypothetical protein
MFGPPSLARMRLRIALTMPKAGEWLPSKERADIVRKLLPGSALQFFAVVVHVRASALI